MAGIKITCRQDYRKAESKEPLAKYIHEQVKTLWRDCVRAFLKEAARHIHIDTGMSAASLYDAAKEVQIAGDILKKIMDGHPRAPHPHYMGIRGGVHKGVNKSIPLGMSLGSTKQAHELSFGTAQNPDLLFKFNIVVFQYKLHEAGANGGDAWDSLEKGKVAFLACWKANVRKQVKPATILKFLLPKAR